MPSIDEIRRRYRAAAPVVVRLPDETSVWKYTWRTMSIVDEAFVADVSANLYETSITRSSFPGATILQGDDNTISSCRFDGSLLVLGDNVNFLDTTFHGPVRFNSDRIAFTGCHFKQGGPEPLPDAPRPSGFVMNGCIATTDNPIVQQFELSLHTAAPTPREPKEASFNGYKRIKHKLKRERSDDGKLAWWTNDVELLFPQCTGGNETITHIVARPVGFDSDDDAKAIKLPFEVQMSVGKAFVIDPHTLQFEL